MAASGGQLGGFFEHHVPKAVCDTRAKYREGRRPRAVRVRTQQDPAAAGGERASGVAEGRCPGSGDATPASGVQGRGTPSCGAAGRLLSDGGRPADRRLQGVGGCLPFAQVCILWLLHAARSHMLPIRTDS